MRNDIRAEFQPLGPYILIGYSFGALIALEMAPRLTEEGKQVALLTFVDTLPRNTRPITHTLKLRASIVEDFLVHPLNHICLASKPLSRAASRNF